ncbi:MAG: type III pantothenate kinase [Chryseotalea sp. WA131a]|jgi:type III pantothenate kinase|nr:MAG: type III pantothenate kinase [Chryseotalea sp. WA131a]
MLLAIDIGNSDITIGIWTDEHWKHHWRIPSKPDQPELFYGVKIRDFFIESSLQVEAVNKIVLSSVVPALNEKVKNVIRTLFQKEPIVVGPKIYELLPIQVLNPYEIGSDLVANAMGAYIKFKRTCIVVDFGTALTFTTISKEGKILGVSIVPGLRTALKALSQNAAKLFDVPLEIPKSALGTSTVTAIQSGIVIGYEGLVRKMVSAIREELNEDCPAIATGGLSFVISPLKDFFHEIDPDLTLDGLRFIGKSVS